MLKTLFVLVLLFAVLPVLMLGYLRQVPPPLTSFMLQSEVKPVDYRWVPAEEIADVARKAVVASEDQKFWDHDGFDFEAMEKVYRQNRKRERKRGASTISQQTAKNLFLWPGGGYLRKGIEAYCTLLMEWLWTKDRILEVYLNIAEFGPGIYGVEAAAQHHFNKAASDLTPTEAARLAAVLPSPRNWSAGKPGPYVLKRSAWILRQMDYRPLPPRVPDPEPEFPGEDIDEFEPAPLPDADAPAEAFSDESEQPARDGVGFETTPLPEDGGWVIEEEPADEETERE